MDLYLEMQIVVWNLNLNFDLVDKKRFCWVLFVLYLIELNKFIKFLYFFLQYSLKYCIVLGFFNVRI